MAESGSPNAPNYHAWYSQYLGMAYTEMQEYDKALSAFEDVTVKAPHQTWGFHRSAVVYIRLGREEKAKKQIAKALAVDPELPLDSLAPANLYKDPKTWERLMEDRRQAGLKECLYRHVNYQFESADYC